MTLFSFQTDNRDAMSNHVEKSLWEIFEASNLSTDEQMTARHFRIYLKV